MVEKGIHYNLGMADYHAWKLDKSKLIEGPISCSVLKAFDTNPYAWLKTDEREPTEAMKKGSLYDAAVTDPASLSEFIESPFGSFRTREAKEWKEAQEADGKTIVPDGSIDRAAEAALKVKLHPIAGPMLENAQWQVGVVGEVGGIPAKALIDILPSEDGDYAETLVDYKTISTGLDDESIRKAIGNYQYHWQAAYYRTLFNKVSEDRVCEDFAFIFQDVNTLEVRVVTLSDDALALGSRSVGSALKQFVSCAHRGIRSRYLKTADVVDLMPYHAMGEDEELCRREEVPE